MLSRNDFYAIGRALVGLPAYEGLVVSFQTQTIIENFYTHQQRGQEKEHFVAALRLIYGDDFIAHIFRENPAAPPPESLRGSGWSLYTPDQLDDLPDIEWLIDKHLQACALNLIYGSAGIGKSFFALDLALQVAQRDTVVYVVGEGVLGYNKRIRAWCQHHHQGWGKLHLTDATVRLLQPGSKEELIERLRPLQPKAVFIDTLARAMVGYDENSTRDMGLFIDACEQIKRELGCAVILIHHTNKIGMIRGNSSLFAAVDMTIKLSGDDDQITVEWEKAKDDEKPYPLYLKRLPVAIEVKGKPTASIVLIPAEQMTQQPADKLNLTQAKILEKLELGIGEVESIIQTAKLGRTTVYRVLRTLEALGFVGKDQPGVYQITEAGRAALAATQPTRSQRTAGHQSDSAERVMAASPTNPVNPTSPIRPTVPDQPTPSGILGTNGIPAVSQGVAPAPSPSLSDQTAAPQEVSPTNPTSPIRPTLPIQPNLNGILGTNGIPTTPTDLPELNTSLMAPPANPASKSPNGTHKGAGR